MCLDKLGKVDGGVLGSVGQTDLLEPGFGCCSTLPKLRRVNFGHAVISTGRRRLTQM